MKKISIYAVLSLLVFAGPAYSQFLIADSDLVRNLQIVHKTVTAGGSTNQDKANLELGTRVCIDLSGTPTNGMVTGGMGSGPNRDAYQITITEGPQHREKRFLRPEGITSVGECPEQYVPIPTKELPSNLDVRSLEEAIVREVNIIRAHPGAYAEEMEKLAFAEFGRASSGSQVQVLTIGNDPMHFCNDQSCVSGYMQKMQVAIDYLKAITGSLSVVTENTCLGAASRMLAADTGTINGPKHLDSSGRDPWQRGEAAGCKKLVRGECLNAHQKTAAGFVVSFLLSPGHRDILMKVDVNLIGVDVHQHGTGTEAHLRDVIIMGAGPVTPPFNHGTVSKSLTCGTTPYVLAGDKRVFELRSGDWQHVGDRCNDLTCDNGQLACASTDGSAWLYQGSPNHWAPHKKDPVTRTVCDGKQFELDSNKRVFELRSGVYVHVGDRCNALTCDNGQLACASTDGSTWLYQGTPQAWSRI